jgi:hypothetical protein
MKRPDIKDLDRLLSQLHRNHPAVFALLTLACGWAIVAAGLAIAHLLGCP